MKHKMSPAWDGSVTRFQHTIDEEINRAQHAQKASKTKSEKTFWIGFRLGLTEAEAKLKA